MFKLTALFVIFFLVSSCLADSAGELIVFPEPMNFTGPVKIPDAAHPYVAPGPDDRRGPCPGLNTLANHGYLPHNGIASVQDIMNAAQEGFNLDYNNSMAFASFAILSRGNALINKVSIGEESPLVPPLPGNIDGTPGGLAKHGRFEGDVSMTREDAAIGDNVHFQPSMYKNLLSFVDKYGSGENVTLPVFQQYRFARFENELRRDPNLTFHSGRDGFGYGEAGFILNLFPSSAHGNLTVDVMTSFFQNETFPPGWIRRASPLTFIELSFAADEVEDPYPVAPGAKNSQGVYVNDTLMNNGCDLEFNLVGQNLPNVLVQTNGTLLANVNTLLGGIHQLFVPNGCPAVTPNGPAGV